MDAETLEAARAVAFRYIGYAARSRREMRLRLEKAEFPPDVIEAVIADCEAAGWINDEKFAHDWIEDRADRKKYGRTRLTAELRRKGVDKETVQEAVETIEDEDEFKRALAAALTKWRVEVLAQMDSETLQAEKRRLANFLQRRGFQWPIITQVLRELMAKPE